MVDLLKSKYEKMDISSFPDLVKLMRFTFHGESTENLISAIKQFESNTPQQGSLNEFELLENFQIPIFICFLLR